MSFLYPEEVIGTVFGFVPTQFKPQISKSHRELPDYFLKWSPWIPVEPVKHKDIITPAYLSSMNETKRKRFDKPIPHRIRHVKKCIIKVNYFDIYSLKEALVLFKTSHIDRLTFFVNACKNNFPTEFLKSIYKSYLLCNQYPSEEDQYLFLKSITHFAASYTIMNNNIKIFEILFNACDLKHKWDMLHTSLCHVNNSEMMLYILNLMKNPIWAGNTGNDEWFRDGDEIYFRVYCLKYKFITLSEVTISRICSLATKKRKDLVMLLLKVVQPKYVQKTSYIFKKLCEVGWNDILETLLKLEIKPTVRSIGNSIIGTYYPGISNLIRDAIGYKNFTALSMFLQDSRFQIPRFFPKELWANSLDFVKCIVNCDRFDPVTHLNRIQQVVTESEPKNSEIVKILIERFGPHFQ